MNHFEIPGVLGWMVLASMVLAGLLLLFWLALNLKNFARRTNRLAFVCMVLLVAVSIKVAGTKPGMFGGMVQSGMNLQSPAQSNANASNTGVPDCAGCAGWPWGNALVALAVEGMDVSVDPFFKSVPENMVQSRYVLEWVETGAEPRTNMAAHPIQLFRNGAKERGVLVDTPFAICGSTEVGIWNTGKISVGGQHGWGKGGEEEWRNEFWVLAGAWEVRPDISTNSSVLYGTTHTNELPASFLVRWQDVFLGGDTNLCASFEAEFFAGTDDVVFRWFEGCDVPAVLADCAMGVAMSGAEWSAPSAVAAGREARLHCLEPPEGEKAVFMDLVLTKFEAWYHQVDTAHTYEIPPGILLDIGLCPHHPETWPDVLPPGVAYFMAFHGKTLAQLLMTQMLNPFEWTPDINDWQEHDPAGNPAHPYLNPGDGCAPLDFVQEAPLPPGTLAQLIIGNLRLPLSSASPQTFTLYLPQGASPVSFELRSLRNPDVSLTIAATTGTNLPAVWLDDPDDIFGFGLNDSEGGGSGGQSFGIMMTNGDGGAGNGNGDGGGGGRSMGGLDLPTARLVPADPDASDPLCVHEYTGWYKMEFSRPFYHTYYSHRIQWSNTGWELETDQSGGVNRARLKNTKDVRTATLTGTLAGGYFIQNTMVSASLDFEPCDHCDNFYHESNLYLSSTKNLLTLKHDRETDLAITHTDLTTPYDAYRIDITRINTIEWLPLAEARTFIPWEATVAGAFYLRGVGIRGGIENYSSNIIVEVHFPSFNDMLSNTAVTNRMTQAWEDTKAATFDSFRREEGYYITLDTESNDYGITAHSLGDPTPNHLSSYWDSAPYQRPPDSIQNPTPLDKPIYTVGWFHTHPPMRYVTYTPPFRLAGFNFGDLNYSTNAILGVSMPGFAYDYIPTNTSPRIFAGHPIHAPGKITHGTLPLRRPLP